MILLNILDHDLHRTRKGKDVTPYLLETPAKPSFLPAIVSSSRGKFIVSRALTKESYLRSGVFPFDSDKMDLMLGDMVSAAYDLSLSEGWGNVFKGAGSAEKAFKYITESSGMPYQPHACLYPSSWGRPELESFFGDKHLSPAGQVLQSYRKTCRLHQCSVAYPVFFSRPDFVGMYTQFTGGMSSVVLHNVRYGMSFCP